MAFTVSYLWLFKIFFEKNIRGRGKFPELAALKRFPALTYKSLQTAPISEWGAKRVRWTRFLLFWPHLCKADFLQNNILKRTIFGRRYTVKQFALQYCVVSTSTLSLSLPTGPQYCSLFSYFCDFIKKERTTTICLSFSNLFSIKNAIFQRKTLFAICTSPIIQLVCPQNIAWALSSISTQEY